MQTLETHPRYRVLVVDDLALNRDMVATVLSASNYDVHVACDGASGCVAACSAPYDLVLMDLDMPEMDGFEAAARIRAREGSAVGVTIAALTSTVTPDAEQRSCDSGMDAFIVRPVAARALVGRVAEILADRAAMAPGTRHPVWNAEAFFDLARALGQDRLNAYLGALSDQISDVVSSMAAGAWGTQAFAYKLHDLISVSGQLGFEEVSQTCRVIEEVRYRGGRRNRMPNLAGAVDRARLAIDGYGLARRGPGA